MSLIEKVKNINRRLNWNEYFMTVSYILANRSSCDRLHVGCLIVKDNRIITTGYNGHIRGSPHTSVIVDGHEQMTIHAETNAIADAANRGVPLNGGTAYVTHYPCINCAKNLISAGIKEVIYAEDYNNNALCSMLYLTAGIRITKYNDEFSERNDDKSDDKNDDKNNDKNSDKINDKSILRSLEIQDTLDNETIEYI